MANLVALASVRVEVKWKRRMRVMFFTPSRFFDCCLFKLIGDLFLWFKAPYIHFNYYWYLMPWLARIFYALLRFFLFFFIQHIFFFDFTTLLSRTLLRPCACKHTQNTVRQACDLKHYTHFFIYAIVFHVDHMCSCTIYLFHIHC